MEDKKFELENASAFWVLALKRSVLFALGVALLCR
jgi:hypothetical protein